MKKLFGRDKPKMAKVVPVSREPVTPIIPENVPQETHSNIYHYSGREPIRRRSSSEERWEVVPTLDEGSLHVHRRPTLVESRSSSMASLPPGASPPIPSPLIPPRSSSPYSATGSRTGTYREREKDRDMKRKPGGGAGGAAALGILRALDPQMIHTDSQSEARLQLDERQTQSEYSFREERKEKKGFWDRGGKDREREKDREKEKEKERDRLKEKDRKDEEGQAELTRMIGYLTATASEDWALVLEVCERASASEGNAKEAARALRREFKYAEPSAQLSAARLWAIMLRNSSGLFVTQTMSRKFLDTVEDVLHSSRTSPVVKERLMDVLAAAAYASGSNGSKDSRSEKDGFRGLWRKVKPLGSPDEGIPFDPEDAMFNPPMPRRSSQYSSDMSVLSSQVYSPKLSPSLGHTEPGSKHKSSFSRNRIIPLEEDMRRLFQECKIGEGNAALLSEALAFAKPEDLTKKEIIREFYMKCRASQELIYAQIPWASAGAERSRLANSRRQTMHESPNGTVELTVEERLLAALLGANEDLLEALRVYDDLERVAVEREAEEISRRDVKMDRSQLHRYDDKSILGPSLSRFNSTSSHSLVSPSVSPDSVISSAPPSHSHPLPRIPHTSHTTTSHNNSNHPYTVAQAAQLAALAQSLAPPPPAPQGPRSPAQLSLSSRAPSPSSTSHSRNNSMESIQDDLHDGVNSLHINSHYHHESITTHPEEVLTPMKPSAKALGKRKVTDTDDADRTFDATENYKHYSDEPSRPYDDSLESDSDDGRWHRQHHPTHYVYDALNERTQQRIREGQLLVNGVH